LTRSSPTGSDVMSMSEEEPATPISFRRLALDASASPPFSCLCALFIDKSPKVTETQSMDRVFGVRETRARDKRSHVLNFRI
jgi:hypothetical protein